MQVAMNQTSSKTQASLMFSNEQNTEKKAKDPNFNTYIIREVKENRGVPRIWLQGTRLVKAGFIPGIKYKILKSQSRVVLTTCDEGDMVVVGKTIKAKNTAEPVIDLNSNKTLGDFKVDDTVRIIMREGEITILLAASGARKAERVARINKEVAEGVPMKIGHLCDSAGTLTLQVFEEKTDNYNFIVDQEKSEQIAFEDWYQSNVPKLHTLEMSMPSYENPVGTKKTNLRMAEEDPDTGHLVAPFLAVIAKTNPVNIVLNSLPSFQDSPSMCMISTYLEEWGYQINIDELHDANGQATSMLVATTNGVDGNAAFFQRSFNRVLKDFTEIQQRQRMPIEKRIQNRSSNFSPFILGRYKERLERARRMVNTGMPLNIGSISHGAGVLSLATHEGFEIGGLTTHLKFANDIREEMLDHSEEYNPCWKSDALYMAAPMQEIAFDEWFVKRLQIIDHCEIGIPCSGASPAGRAKRKISYPEAHPEVGHLAIAFLGIVLKTAPISINLECVPSYVNTASMHIIRNQLQRWGYEVHTTEFSGKEFNAVENRKRMTMVAVTMGMQYDFDWVEKPEPIQTSVASIMENIPLDDPSWSKMEGLKEKEKRDKAAGKGFAMQIFTGAEPHIGTLTKGLAKNRSTDCKFQHPTNPDLLRIPTETEHANAKQIPLVLVQGKSKTFIHEFLGQSIIYTMFVEVAKSIARSFKESFTGSGIMNRIPIATMQ